MVKNLQCLKTPQICYLRHAEHHAKKRTSLRGLVHDTLFLNDPLPAKTTTKKSMMKTEATTTKPITKTTTTTDNNNHHHKR